ncbi:MAG TPA: HlyD family efflux transporter periplasmic adaptor subunit [Candidatus Binatia bacterium]
MNRKVVFAAIVLIAAAAVIAVYLRRDGAALYYTGFVEGEERVIRSEVMGRVLAVTYAEGATVPPNAVIARLDDQDIAARIKSKQEELAVLDADMGTQSERIELTQNTWQRDLNARRADVSQAAAAATLAERTLAREQELVKTGSSTPQLLDDNRSRRDQARSVLERTREMLARAEAEERTVSLAMHELASMKEKHELELAQLAELQVTQSKSMIRSPATNTVVQTQFIWPGELAQPGTAIVAVLDPVDKYVQIYVPVADVGRLHIGQRVRIELDSQPGTRVPGDVSFIADRANFTPEKIETRSDRMGQVYRVKVRILEGVERFQPGTEGNVYLDS